MKQPNYFRSAFWICVALLLVVFAHEMGSPHYFR